MSARMTVRDTHGLRLWLRLLIGAAAIVVTWLAAQALPGATVFTLTSIAMATLWAVSLNIVVGFTGQLNLSLGAFIALGAYLGVLGTGFWGWAGWQVLVGVILAAGVTSFLLSLVVFRAKGLHFALLTAGLSLAVYSLLLAWTDVTGGAAGVSTGGPVILAQPPKPLAFGPLVLRPMDYLLTTVILIVVLTLVLSVVLRRREGLGWLAVKEDELLSASVGIRVANRKRVAFVFCSVVAAISGMLYAHWIGFISPSAFSFVAATFDPLAMVIIGGAGTLAGPIIGALVVAGLPEIVRGLEDYAVLIYGVVLLFIILVAPGGLVQLAKTAWRRIVGSVSTRRTPAGGSEPAGSPTENAGSPTENAGSPTENAGSPTENGVRS